ncbi:MAG: hypothetical protein IJV58_05025 [Oscillospiraceae bacterium]|nr:hypothetical protein [Oscillospiraceae bacterium]
MKPLIECIRDYVMEFPDLKDGFLLVDYLGNNAVEYTVDAVPCDPIYKRYTDGSCMKQFLFLFASREFYNADVNQCIENLAFYENFQEWIMERNLEGLLPDLDGRTPVAVEVLTGGYAFLAEDKTARYQIQLRLIYEE